MIRVCVAVSANSGSATGDNICQEKKMSGERGLTSTLASSSLTNAMNTTPQTRSSRAASTYALCNPCMAFLPAAWTITPVTRGAIKPGNVAMPTTTPWKNPRCACGATSRTMAPSKGMAAPAVAARMKKVTAPSVEGMLIARERKTAPRMSSAPAGKTRDLRALPVRRKARSASAPHAKSVSP